MTDQIKPTIVETMAKSIGVYRQHLIKSGITGPLADEMLKEYNRQLCTAIAPYIATRIQSGTAHPYPTKPSAEELLAKFEAASA